MGILRKWNSMSLIVRILIGLVIGAMVGQRFADLSTPVSQKGSEHLVLNGDIMDLYIKLFIFPYVIHKSLQA